MITQDRQTLSLTFESLIILFDVLCNCNSFNDHDGGGTKEEEEKDLQKFFLLNMRHFSMISTTTAV